MRLPEFLDSQHMKVGKVVSPTHWLPLLPGTSVVLVSVKRLSRTQSHSAVKRSGYKYRPLSMQ